MSTVWVDSMLVGWGQGMVSSFLPITLTAALLAAALLAARRTSPEIRHALAVLALLAVPVLFLADFHLPGQFGPGTAILRSAAQPFVLAEMVDEAGVTDWARSLALVWFAGVLLLSLRTLGGWLYLRGLLHRATPLDAPRFGELCRRMKVLRPVIVGTSLRGDSPFTAGWRRPVILIPLAMASGLPADQLEAILLHELAHIRRGDYLAEWALRVVETLFFYHPAVWWMTAAVRREREMCCDDMAIAAGADRGVYARALVRLEELRVPALANGGAGSGTRQRVMRILGSPQATAPWPMLAVLAMAWVGVWAPAVTAQPPAVYQRWGNEDAAYIMLPEERRRWESLRTNEECEEFIVAFWQRRDPTPGTMENEAKEEHYRRIAYVNELYGEKNLAGWKTKRGRIYLVYGPPDDIESHPSEHVDRWFYKFIHGVGDNVSFTFYTQPGSR
ncbi:MAG TPA: M56 family metallopeptidase [Bryobacteraceae bacterium]|nr:M56 family metallopeptidase [Bryobacteraceae bacterium]